jgi:hypothetical protein
MLLSNVPAFQAKHGSVDEEFEGSGTVQLDEVLGVPSEFVATFPSESRLKALRVPVQISLVGLDTNEARYARVLPVVLVVGMTGDTNS